MNKGFSIGEVLRFSWNAFKENAIPLLLLTLMTFLVQMLFGIPACGHQDFQIGPAQMGGGCFLFSLLHLLVNTLIGMGFATVGLSAAAGEKVTFDQFFSKFNKFFPFFIAMILYSLIVLAGLILFIVPGIYWALKYCMYPYAVLDKGASGWTALKLSDQATYGVKWELLGFYAISFLIFLAGLLTFGLGLFIAVPLLSIAQAYVWKQLTNVGATP